MLKKFFIILVFISGCSLLDINYYDNYSDPEYNYDMFWEELNDYYGLIDLKSQLHINDEFGSWNGLYLDHKSYIDSNSSERELFSVLSSILYRLRDSHSYWLSSRVPEYYWEIPGESDYPHPQGVDWGSDPSELPPSASYGHGAYFIDLRVPSGYLINDSYFGEGLLYSGIVDNSKLYEKSPIQSGTLDSSLRIGYIHIVSFIQNSNVKDLSAAQEWSRDIDLAIEHLGNIDGLIIDVRQNSGGFEGNLERILNRFISQKRLLYYSYTRNGPNRNDFSKDSYWGNPSNIGWRGPTVVLTDDGTSSCGDIFALVMKDEEHATLIGQNTRGIMGKVIARELPIGWSFRMSSGYTESKDGEVYEEVGIEPDIIITPESVSDSYNSYDDYHYYDPIFCESVEILEDIIKGGNL